MDETQFLGYLVTAIITLGAFVVVIQRLTQPINDLRVVIQELRDCVNTLKTDNANQNQQLVSHSKEIDELKAKVNCLQTKVDMYHGK